MKQTSKKKASETYTGAKRQRNTNPTQFRNHEEPNKAYKSDYKTHPSSRDRRSIAPCKTNSLTAQPQPQGIPLAKPTDTLKHACAAVLLTNH